MAKIALNSAIASIRGGIDNWVYRRTRDGNILGRRPINTRPPTAAQLGVREQFRLAAAYGRSVLADETLAGRYNTAARARGMLTFPFAIRDYLNPPEVLSIDTTEYAKAIGNAIRVRATDDLEVTGVRISIQDADDDVLEEGAAVLMDGQWRYTTTTAAPTAASVKAVATGLPGNTGERMVLLAS
jgi:hypothetical protein